MLDGWQRRSRRKVGGVQEQALDATFSLIQPVDQRLGFDSFLLRDIKVRDVLGIVLELAQLLLQTCFSRKQGQNYNLP
jgi:hypothetical protein